MNYIQIKFSVGYTNVEYTWRTDTDEFTENCECGDHGTLRPIDKENIPKPVLDAMYALNIADLEF